MKTHPLKAEKIRHHLKQVTFQEVAEGEGDSLKNHFIRYLSTGEMAVKKQEKKPEVPQEEIQRRRLEQLERETYQRAFAAGEQAGLEAARQKTEAQLLQLEQLVAPLGTLAGQIYHEMVIQSEQVLVDTAIRLVRNLFRHELSVNPEGIRERVRKILLQARGRKDLTLFLSPGDKALIASIPRYKGLKLVADPELPSGSVRLETGFGGVQDHLDDKLEQVEKGLRDYLATRMDELQSQPPPKNVPLPDMPLEALREGSEPEMESDPSADEEAQGGPDMAWESTPDEVDSAAGWMAEEAPDLEEEGMASAVDAAAGDDPGRMDAGISPSLDETGSIGAAEEALAEDSGAPAAGPVVEQALDDAAAFEEIQDSGEQALDDAAAFEETQDQGLQAMMARRQAAAGEAGEPVVASSGWGAEAASQGETGPAAPSGLDDAPPAEPVEQETQAEVSAPPPDAAGAPVPEAVSPAVARLDALPVEDGDDDPPVVIKQSHRRGSGPGKGGLTESQKRAMAAAEAGLDAHGADDDHPVEIKPSLSRKKNTFAAGLEGLDEDWDSLGLNEADAEALANLGITQGEMDAFEDEL